MKPSYLLLLFTLLFGAFLWIVRPAAPERVRTPRQPTVVQNPSPDNRQLERVVLRGAVQDRFGWPVGGAVVTARPSVGGNSVATATSDADGVFALQLPDISPVDLQVVAEGHGAEWVRRFPATREAGCIVLGAALPWAAVGSETGGSETGADAEAQLPSWEGGRLAGEGFVKTADGDLAAGVLVVVEQTGLSARTDENGQFRVGLPATACTLRARSTDGAVATLLVDAPLKQEGLAPIPDLVLATGLAMEGMVTRPDGAVAADVPVHVRGAGVDDWVVTDGTGSFVMSALTAGEYAVTAYAHEGALGVRTMTTLSRDSSVLHLRLLAESPLTVRVMRGEIPVASAHVYCSEDQGLRWSHAQADDEGVVRMRGLAAAPRRFEVRAHQTWDEMEVLGFDEASGVLSVR